MADLDFELEIRSSEGGQFEVEVVRSPAGVATAPMRFSFDEVGLKVRLQALEIALLRAGVARRRMSSPEAETVLEFGRELFDTLITGEVRSRFDMSRADALRQGKVLRIKLRFDTPALAALPWEFLHDVRTGEYVSLSTHTPLVRYVEQPALIEPLGVSPPLHLLGVVSAPSDRPTLCVEREQMRLVEATRSLQDQGLLEIHWLVNPTWRDIQQALRRDEWHIFHFVGDGGFDQNTNEGVIALVDESGGTYRLPAIELARLLGDHETMRLVLLSACEGTRAIDVDRFSSTASVLVRRGTPAVVAMQYEITDNAAIEFSRSFYEGIADGMPVDVAVAEARKSMSIVVNSLEWGTPVLFMRTPDGVLFRMPLEAAEPALVAAAAVSEPGPDPPGLGGLVAPGATESGSAAIDENVQFTVYRPRTIQPTLWYPLVAFAHLSERRADAPDDPDPIQEVDRQARQTLGEQFTGYTQLTEDFLSSIPREGELTLIPTATGITFNPRSRSFIWTESVHREEFRLQADRETAGTTVRGRLSVFSGVLLVADVGLSFRVVADAIPDAPIDQGVDHLRHYRKIFASYSHKDVEIAQLLERYASLFGDRYLRDRVDLRAGQLWREELRQLIRDADVFQLLWSSNAMRSDYVRQEYEYALSLGRPEFVRPTYWEHPLPQDAAAGLPPEELRALHFQRFAVSSLEGSNEVDLAAEVASDGSDLAAEQRRPAEAADRARLAREWAEADRDQEARAPLEPEPARARTRDAGDVATPPPPEAAVIRPEEHVGPPGITCEVCGTQNDRARVYCMRCGSKLSPASPRLTPAGAPARRPMTRLPLFLLPMLLLLGLLLLGILATVAFVGRPPS